MLKFYRLTVFMTLLIILPSSLHGQAKTLKFAWPDGASAKVHVRSEGRRVSTGETNTWDMFCDFTIQLKRINDRIVVSRNNYSGWKGAFPPTFGGGAERYVDMIPTWIVTEGGMFVGIEGHETARKLMNGSVAQSGGLDPIQRAAFEIVSSNASLEAMAKTHWAFLVVLWQDVELDPEFSYEFRSVAEVPQLRGGKVDINGVVKFVKEAPCESTRNDQRCIHLHAESTADKAQVRKIIESLFQQLDANHPTITAWDQQIKVDIVVDKTTMLPHHLKITRLNSITLKHKTLPQDEGGSQEELTTTYTFTWLSAPGSSSLRAGDPTKDSALDFSHVTSKETALKLASEGKLVKILLVPAKLGGADIPENVVYVPPRVLEIQNQITDEIVRLVEEGLNIKLGVMPEYKGNSFVPAKIHIKASHAEKRGNFERTIEIW
jgi:hypothetical protein